MRNIKLLCATLIAALSTTACTMQPTLNRLVAAQVANPPETISVKISGYVTPPGRVFKNLFVSNYSVKAAKGQLTYSTARDGLGDDVKTALTADYGFSISSVDSSSAGFGDLLTYLAGVKLPAQKLLYCGPTQATNTSNDGISYMDARYPGSPPAFLGLRDCAKLFLGLDPNKFDYDGDGIPDYLELRCGLNPKNPNDVNLAIAGDPMTNLEKCKSHIPADESSLSQPNKLFAYNYHTDTHLDATKDFTVSNIPVLNGGVDNLIVFYITEVDQQSNRQYFYSAYLLMKSGFVGRTAQIKYWGLNPVTAQNQELVLQ